MGIEIANNFGSSIWDAPDMDERLIGSTWQALDLTDVVQGLVSGTLTRYKPTVGVRSDGAALFYPGKVNGVAGASGSGKTWTALVTAAQEIAAARHVIYIDLEDDAVGIAGRMLDLGADPAMLVSHFHYVQPDEPYGDRAANLFANQLLDVYTPALVVIDSTGESLSLEGVQPNADEEVAAWFRRLPRTIAKGGAAVLILDHMAKDENGGMWPIGSQRKRAAIDGAQYVQTTVKAFDKDTPGIAKLVAAKDRHGNYRAGSKAAELHVTPGDGVNVELRAPSASVDESGKWRPTGIMEQVSRALEAAEEPLTFNQLNNEVSGRRDNVRTAIDVLAAEGFLSITDGQRQSKLHEHTKVYRQSEDPRSDRYEDAGTTQRSPSGSTGPVPIDGEPGTSGFTVPGTSREPVETSAGLGVKTCRVCCQPLRDTDGTGVHINCAVDEAVV